MEAEPSEGQTFNDGLMLLASAAKFLIEGGQKEAANVLLACSELETDYVDTASPLGGGGDDVDIVTVVLRGPRWVYDLITGDSADANRLQGEIHEALKACSPSRLYIQGLWGKPEAPQFGPQWREQLLEAARGSSVHNQAADVERVIIWKGLRFRSNAEVRIADALDHAKVLFFPNCRARLNTPSGRDNKEADFLICQDGKWGVLEVDGAPFHPPSMAAQDHERQRLFRHHGILVFERFTANRCWEHPNEVASEFLSILAKS